MFSYHNSISESWNGIIFTLCPFSTTLLSCRQVPLPDIFTKFYQNTDRIRDNIDSHQNRTNNNIWDNIININNNSNNNNNIIKKKTTTGSLRTTTTTP